MSCLAQGGLRSLSAHVHNELAIYKLEILLGSYGPLNITSCIMSEVPVPIYICMKFTSGH